MVLCDEGRILYSEGEPARGIFILCNGRAKVSIASGRGSVVILSIAQAGEALGLAAVLSNHPNRDTAQVLDACQVKFIPKQQLKPFLFGHAPMTLKTTLQMTADYNSAREQIRRLGFSMSGTQKLAQLLIEWANRTTSKRTGESTFTVPYTHEEIAHMIGSARETVTRVLMKFRARKVIEIQGKTFFVKDTERLAEFAEG
jgi:CRP/FNR family cyclic AMP-dependent transcriptional regulator